MGKGEDRLLHALSLPLEKTPPESPPAHAAARHSLDLLPVLGELPLPRDDEPVRERLHLLVGVLPQLSDGQADVGRLEQAARARPAFSAEHGTSHW